MQQITDAEYRPSKVASDNPLIMVCFFLIYLSPKPLLGERT